MEQVEQEMSGKSRLEKRIYLTNWKIKYTDICWNAWLVSHPYSR